MTRLLPLIALTVTVLLPTAAWPSAFDHRHSAWDALLKRHVVPGQSSGTSRVRYRELAAERPALRDYLASLSAVRPAEYAGWSRNQQLAFLINAYNAFTVELILGAYPKLDSIKDLGSLFQSPWKQRFFTLLGEKHHLDDIEHGMIRARGVFDDPRIHAAVVCAAVSCPKLRNEAYVADRLDTQLENGLTEFLRDPSRNRFDAPSHTVYLSKIFDWYGEDFAQGHRGFDSLQGLIHRYAAELAGSAADRLRSRPADIEFLEYDWRLNDSARP